MEDILYIVQVTKYHSNQYLIDNNNNSYGWTSFILNCILVIRRTREYTVHNIGLPGRL